MILLRQGCCNEMPKPIMIPTFHFLLQSILCWFRWYKKLFFDLYSPLYDAISTASLFDLLLLSTASSSFLFPPSTALSLVCCSVNVGEELYIL